MIRIEALIKPVPFPRPRFDSRSKQTFNPKRYRDFKEELGLMARLAMKGHAPFAGEIKLRADFYRPKPKRSKQVSFIGDVDNYLKAVMDSLIGICYEDDRQVVETHARKLFGTPHIEIELEEITHDDERIKKKLEDLKKEFVQAKERLTNQILDEIDEPTLQTLLILCCVNLMTWTQIARQMNFERSWVFRRYQKISNTLKRREH